MDTSNKKNYQNFELNKKINFRNITSIWQETILQIPYIRSNSLEETQVTGPSIGHCHWVQNLASQPEFFVQQKNPWEMDCVLFWMFFVWCLFLQIKKNTKVSLRVSSEMSFFVSINTCMFWRLDIVWKRYSSKCLDCRVLMVAFFMFHVSSSSNFCDVQSAQMALKSCGLAGPYKTYCEKGLDSISYPYNQLPSITDPNAFETSVSHNIEYHHTTQPRIHQSLRCVY